LVARVAILMKDPADIAMAGHPDAARELRKQADQFTVANMAPAARFCAGVARLAEVLSWHSHCRRALREWATTNGTFIRLDDYYESLTFLEGARRAKPLDLSQRPKSVPRVSPVRNAELKAKMESDAQLLALQRELEVLKAKAASKAKGKAKYEKRMSRRKATA